MAPTAIHTAKVKSACCNSLNKAGFWDDAQTPHCNIFLSCASRKPKEFTCSSHVYIVGPFETKYEFAWFHPVRIRAHCNSPCSNCHVCLCILAPSTSRSFFRRFAMGDTGPSRTMFATRNKGLTSNNVC